MAGQLNENVGGFAWTWTRGSVRRCLRFREWFGSREGDRELDGVRLRKVKAGKTWPLTCRGAWTRRWRDGNQALLGRCSCDLVYPLVPRFGNLAGEEYYDDDLLRGAVGADGTATLAAAWGWRGGRGREERAGEKTSGRKRTGRWLYKWEAERCCRAGVAIEQVPDAGQAPHPRLARSR